MLFEECLVGSRKYSDSLRIFSVGKGVSHCVYGEKGNNGGLTSFLATLSVRVRCDTVVNTIEEHESNQSHREHRCENHEHETNNSLCASFYM